MLNEINMILSKATQQNIPQKFKQVYLDIYPMIMYYIKRNTRRPNVVIEDLKLTGYDTVDFTVGRREFNDIICLYITIQYRGIENDENLLRAIKESNIYYGMGINNVDIPDGFAIVLEAKYLGPAQKVYENPEFEDDLEKRYIEFKNSGILKSYSIMLKEFVNIIDSDDIYPLFHGGNHTAGILNVKYPIINRLSTSIKLNNYVNIILDNSDKWKAYPRRRASIMFSDSSRIAEAYGSTLYCIFPQNSAKIGICPRPDFWDVFRYDSNDGYILSTHSINNLLQYFSAKVLSRNVNLTSYVKFKNDVDKIEKYIRKLNLETAKMPSSAANAIRLIKNVTQLKNYTFFDFLEDFIKPNYSGDSRFDFIATNTNNLVHTYNKNYGSFSEFYVYTSPASSHELWTDSPCLILASTATKELAEYIKKYGLGE